MEAAKILKHSALLAPSTFLIICLLSLPQISETLYAPALPALTDSLETSSALIQWTLSIYFMGFALGIGCWGKLSDHVGRRATILAGLLLFIFMSFACNNASTITYLLIARFFQAFGVSVGLVVTTAIMRDCFTGVERNKLFSFITSVIALTPAIGPIAGGYLTEHFSWHANFIFLTLLGIIILIYAGLALPETKKVVLDTLVPEISVEASIKQLVLDKHVMACAFLMGGFNGILFSYYATAPFLIINVFDLSPGQFGTLGVFMAAGLGIGSLISHQIKHWIAATKVIKISCYALVFLMVLFSALAVLNVINENTPSSVYLIMFFMMSFYMCFGIAIPNVLSTALSRYQPHVGTASAIFGVIYYFWVALYIFAIGSFNPHSFLVMPLYFLAISVLMALTVKSLQD